MTQKNLNTSTPKAVGNLSRESNNIVDTCICIVNYQSSDLVAKLARHLSPIVRAIVVVDNFSTSIEREALNTGLQSIANVNALFLDNNLGFGDGCNLAAEQAVEIACRTLIFMNPDVWMTRDNLEKLVQTIEANHHALVSPVIQMPDGGVWFQGGVLRERIGSAEHDGSLNTSPDWLSGCVLGALATDWHQYGQFDSRFFLYWEDVDLSDRWRARGGSLKISNESIAVHSVGGSQGLESGGHDKTPTYMYYMFRNRLLYFRIHRGWLHYLRIVCATPAYFVRMRGRFLVDGRIRWSLVSAAFRGSWAGLALRVGPVTRANS